MNWKGFSNRCLELLGDDLVGIYLFGPSAKERIPVYDGYSLVVVLKQSDKDTLKKLKEIGNLFRDETGRDDLVPLTVNELIESEPLFRIGYFMRAEKVYGKDIASLTGVPSKKEVLKDLIKTVKHWKLRITRAIASFEFWNNFRKRLDCYFTMNQIPHLLSAFYFIRNGEYPISRAQLKRKGDPDLTLLCDLLDKYYGASLQEIEKGLWASLSLLSRIERRLETEG